MRIALTPILILILGHSLAIAQQSAVPPSVDDAQAPPIKVLVEEVSLQFTVTDSKNHFITDLGKGDFQILEEKKPQPISSFSKETDLPLRLG